MLVSKLLPILEEFLTEIEPTEAAQFLKAFSKGNSSAHKTVELCTVLAWFLQLCSCSMLWVSQHGLLKVTVFVTS